MAAATASPAPQALTGLPPAPQGLPPRSEAPGASLEDRIRAVELRLITREEALHKRFALLRERLRGATKPRRWVAPALGIAAGGAALWWVLRHGWRHAAFAPVDARTAAAATPQEARGAPREFPWVRLIGLAWPLLPLRWRSRISPGTATTVVTLGLPLLERLFQRRRHPPLAAAPRVDLARFAGTWHEIARLPAPFEARCAGQPSATYRPTAEGLEVVNRCPRSDGTLAEARGAARVVPGSGNARLRVSFAPPAWRWLPAAWSELWVLHVDDAYSVALLGHPDRRALWLLSREPVLAPPQELALIDLAAAKGYPVERLQRVAPH